jgi:hypothetical protein
MFGAANVKLHAVSIAADLSRSAEARSHAEDIDPEEIPSRERRAVWASRSPGPTISAATTRPHQIIADYAARKVSRSLPGHPDDLAPGRHRG